MIQVTTETRTPAKRLLNTYHDSRAVRTWTLAQLSDALDGLVREGLMTREGVERALNPTTYTPPPATSDTGGHGDDGESDDSANEDAADAEDGESDASNAEDGAPSTQPPPPMQSDSDYVTHPELEQARTEDRAYVDGVTNELYAQVNGRVDKAAKAHKELCESHGALIAKHATLADRVDAIETNAPRTLEITVADLPTVTIDSPHYMLERVLKHVAAGNNVALVGPAGTGKSYLSRQVAKALGREYFTNGALMSKYDLIGFVDANGTYHETPAYRAVTRGGLHCFDELDGSVAEAVVAFNGMIDDQPFYTFPCGQVEKHPDYVAIACMNTFGYGPNAEYVGRFKQDAASMDRFVTLYIDYDRKVEAALGDDDIVKRVWALRDATQALGIKRVVSTRMIIKAMKARAAGMSRADIDSDVFFAGMDDDTIAQLKARMKGSD